MFDPIYSASTTTDACPCGAPHSLSQHNDAFAKLSAPPQLASPAVVGKDVETAMADLAEDRLHDHPRRR